MTEQEYSAIFDGYWNWLISRFNKGEQIFYSPIVGNQRVIEEISDHQVHLIETTERGHRSTCRREDLKDDFRYLLDDPEMMKSNPKLMEIMRNHKIKNLREYKREMFLEFQAYISELGVDTAV